MRQLIRDSIKNYKNLLYRLPWLLLMAACGLMYEYLNVFRGKTYNVIMPLDTLIPFNKYFIIPYIIWYGYIGFPIFYYALYDEKRYFKMLAGIITGMITCFVLYYFYPTVVYRPQVNGNDIFSILVRFIYSNDNPYNCCPSLHVLESVVFAIYINRDLSISKNTKIISSVTCILIVLSTLFVKQHYVLDAITGIILSYGIYYVYNFNEINAKISSKYKVYAEVDEKR